MLGGALIDRLLSPLGMVLTKGIEMHLLQKISTSLVEALNSCGLYTQKQYLEKVERTDQTARYAEVLEKYIFDVSDLSKPILVFGECVRMSNIQLRHGQQIIVSPRAKFVEISGVLCLEKDVPQIKQEA
jgi:hypothetical protein